MSRFTQHFIYVLLATFVISCSEKKDILDQDSEIEQKISEIIAGMSLQEKVGQTCQITLEVLLKRDSNNNVVEPIRIDTNKINEALIKHKIGSILNVGWHTLDMAQWSSVFNGVHEPYLSNKTSIPIIYGIDAIHGVNYTIGATLFPQEIGLAATWNPELANNFGHITAYETRASGIHWNFSPVLDIARQPLWSRFFETLGEDPYLASVMGESIVDGYQGSDTIDAFHTAACLKHFVGYSAPFSGRDRTPAWIPEKYMHELYLAPFKKSVEAGALTLMINSGDVNGVPGHINYHLLTETLKDEWGFKGFTVSDWEDFIMLETVHKIGSTYKEAIIKGFNAGVDMSMVPLSSYYQQYCELMIESVEEGKISIERLNDAVRRILRVKMAVGLYMDNMNQASQYPEFGNKDYKETAKKSALESITLLKNKNNILPLSNTSKVLVAGPTANNLIYLNGAWTHTWQGADTSFNTNGCKTIYEAIANEVGSENCEFSQGAELYFENGFEQCRLLGDSDFNSKAENSDVIILCLGELPATEKPGDIRSLDLLPAQLELAKIAYATNKPVVLVLTEGRPRVIHDIVDGASAIFQTYLPGDYGGTALSELLFGRQNPSGKLPYTYPKYAGVIEFYDHPRSVDRDKSGQFNAYDPEWNFGFGLSYTTFEYSDLVLSSSEITSNDTLEISVKVKNTGEIAGKEVVQLYLQDKVASLVPAGKRLKCFEKIELKPGEIKTVNFIISIEDLKFATNSGKWIFEPGQFGILIGDQTMEFQLK